MSARGKEPNIPSLLSPSLPERNKSFGEVVSAGGDPVFDNLRSEQFASGDLFGERTHGAVVVSAVEFDEFAISVGSGGELGGEFGAEDLNTDLFSRFADGTGGLTFADIDVASGVAVPFQKRDIFEVGALLQVDIVARVDDEDVDGAVQKPLAWTSPRGS